ncbi:hypothetical protein FHT76_004166 [Rhizobium sp. BK176]|nr:hypothetical protein [Rhizobium sp. BK399]MCS3740665.1 hypothetical protein [Rhizobium sp. BK661]MCS4092499.1 hypothetical protein [Rhizobium sp. BK176]
MSQPNDSKQTTALLFVDRAAEPQGAPPSP